MMSLARNYLSTVSVNFLLRKYCNYLNNIDMALLRTSYNNNNNNNIYLKSNIQKSSIDYK